MGKVSREGNKRRRRKSTRKTIERSRKSMWKTSEWWMRSMRKKSSSWIWKSTKWPTRSAVSSTAIKLAYLSFLFRTTYSTAPSSNKSNKPLNNSSTKPNTKSKPHGNNSSNLTLSTDLQVFNSHYSIGTEKINLLNYYMSQIIDHLLTDHNKNFVMNGLNDFEIATPFAKRLEDKEM